MAFRSLWVLGISITDIGHVRADDYSMCRDEECGDCPVTLAGIGTVYPECITYNTEDVLGGQDFPPSDVRDFRAYFDVPEQDVAENCYLIVKSPARQGRKACGLVRNTYQQATCGKLDLEETFMVQFCCGFCDCGAAGIPNQPECSSKFGALASGGGESYGAVRLQRNGTLITPAYEGPADAVTPETEATPSQHTRAQLLAAREDGICNGDWKPGPNEGDASYIRPADGATIVRTDVDGGTSGSEVEISHSRSQSWSTTIKMSLGIADILSLGLSFSSTFEESITDTATTTMNVPAGEIGYAIFTAYIRCSVGSGTCNGETVEGEVCTPYRQSNGEIAGVFSVVIDGG
ncbi:hypothetical protein PG994_009851 [Apiospora phragmitis]|uniref:Uncharacterized protein n=1 Tax=Apiospora phragmitis TaxID=2905665 RepID=A0ABR1TNA2_9PEZI